VVFSNCPGTILTCHQLDPDEFCSRLLSLADSKDLKTSQLSFKLLSELSKLPLGQHLIFQQNIKVLGKAFSLQDPVLHRSLLGILAQLFKTPRGKDLFQEDSEPIFQTVKGILQELPQEKEGMGGDGQVEAVTLLSLLTEQEEHQRRVFEETSMMENLLHMPFSQNNSLSNRSTVCLVNIFSWASSSSFPLEFSRLYPSLEVFVQRLSSAFQSTFHPEGLQKEPEEKDEDRLIQIVTNGIRVASFVDWGMDSRLQEMSKPLVLPLVEIVSRKQQDAPLLIYSLTTLSFLVGETLFFFLSPFIKEGIQKRIYIQLNFQHRRQESSGNCQPTEARGGFHFFLDFAACNQF